MSASKNILMADHAYKAANPCSSRDIPGCFVICPSCDEGPRRRNDGRQRQTRSIGKGAIETAPAMCAGRPTGLGRAMCRQWAQWSAPRENPGMTLARRGGASAIKDSPITRSGGCWSRSEVRAVSGRVQFPRPLRAIRCDRRRRRRGVRSSWSCFAGFAGSQTASSSGR